MKNKLILALSLAFIIIFWWPNNEKLTLDSFKNKEQNSICYDRDTQAFTSVVDSHLHFRPFGGQAIPFTELTEYLNKTGVLFANVYGIGQSLPADSNCTYYLDCKGTPAVPSIKNDFVNAANFVEFKAKGIELTLSMTFPDLANPQNIVEIIHLYDREYPKMFKWMGEVNLIKQALLNNGHKPATEQDIKQWSDFMTLLEKRGIPLNIHADLGKDTEPFKYLKLMKKVLELYPNNKIVWAHMGLSLELQSLDPKEHIELMKSLLDKYPKLTLDYSWRVVEDYYLSKYRDLYVDFFNEYSTRFLPGTDFVAARNKDFDTYKEELEVTNQINKDLDDNAFRNIALGGNYFRLLDLNYTAPMVCED